MSFNNVKGWGFLRIEGDEEVFFIRDDCPAQRAFQGNPGDTCQYDFLETRPDGKRRAKGVRNISGFQLAEPAVADRDGGIPPGTLTATVASFNGTKGWGFVTLEDGEDAFFIRDECPAQRAFTAKVGDMVFVDSVEIQEGGKRRARGVRLATAAVSNGFVQQAPVAALPPVVLPAVSPAVDMLRGTISSFNGEKGWGFVALPDGEDAFFIRDECPAGRAFQALKGQEVLVETIEVREDGKRRAKGVRLTAATFGAVAAPLAGLNAGLGAAAAAPPATGTVVSFNPNKGWGFVRTAAGEEAFFIRDESPAGHSLQVSPGDPVTWAEMDIREDGKLRARGVQLARGGIGGLAVGAALSSGGGFGGAAGPGGTVRLGINVPAIVLSFNNEKGWGFVKLTNGDDAFFVRDECNEGRSFQCQAGDSAIVASLELRCDGKKRARGVRLVNKAFNNLGSAGAQKRPQAAPVFMAAKRPRLPGYLVRV